MNPDIKVPTRPFRRMEYVDAIEFCRKHDIRNPANDLPFEFGDDIRKHLALSPPLAPSTTLTLSRGT